VVVRVACSGILALGMDGPALGYRRDRGGTRMVGRRGRGLRSAADVGARGVPCLCTGVPSCRGCSPLRNIWVLPGPFA